MPSLLKLPGRKGTAAFSLQELLVSVVIIAILAAIAVPAFKRALMTAAAGKSVHNVRRMQLANMQYATDMNGWYVPYNIIVDGDPYSGQWLRNKLFLKYLGITSFPHTKTDYPPEYLSPKSTLGRYPDGYGPISRSYAYNSNIFDATNPKTTELKIKDTQIKRPAALLAFADSLDFWISILYADNYRDGVEEYVKGGVAYRYDGRAAVVYFDGHAALLTKKEVVGKQALWLNQ